MAVRAKLCTCSLHRPSALETLRAVPQYDPTRTTSLRARFVQDGSARWRRLIRDMRISIVDNDCFGIVSGERPVTLAAVEPGRYKFLHTQGKIDGFMDWLRKEEENGVLQIVPRARARPDRYVRPTAWTEMDELEPWSNIYIRNAYQRGVVRARNNLRKQVRAAGLNPDRFVPTEITAAFAQPFHAERVAFIYTRAFEDLKTATQVANARMRRELTEGLTTGISRGMAEGKHPMRIARELHKDLGEVGKKVGIHRFRLIARTEVIAAHHRANIAEYRLAARELAEEGLDVRVEIKAEWLTGANPCVQCEAQAAKGLYTMDEIETLIPFHPQCRCEASPKIVDKGTGKPIYRERWSSEEIRRVSSKWEKGTDPYKLFLIRHSRN